MNFAPFGRLVARITGSRRGASAQTGRRQPRGARLLLEVLEVRNLLSTFTVTDFGDGVPDGQAPYTLRDAIGLANNHVGADTVNFVGNGTINLTNGPLEVTGDTTTITTTKAGVVYTVAVTQADPFSDAFVTNGNTTVQGLTLANTGGIAVQTGKLLATNVLFGGGSKAVVVSAGATGNLINVNVVGVTAINGSAAIDNFGTLTINGSFVRDSQGDGVDNFGTLVVKDSSFLYNNLIYAGLYNHGAIVSFGTLTVSGTFVQDGGAVGIAAIDGAYNITSTIITGNTIGFEVGIPTPSTPVNPHGSMSLGLIANNDLGVLEYGGSLTLSTVPVIHNSPNASTDTLGGGILAYGGKLSLIKQCMVLNNLQGPFTSFSNDKAGIIYVAPLGTTTSSNSLTVDHSTIGNTGLPGQFIHGILVRAEVPLSARILYSTVANNTYGGVYIASATPTGTTVLSQSNTIANNAFGVMNGGPAVWTVSNTVLFANQTSWTGYLSGYVKDKGYNGLDADEQGMLSAGFTATTNVWYGGFLPAVSSVLVDVGLGVYVLPLVGSGPFVMGGNPAENDKQPEAGLPYGVRVVGQTEIGSTTVILVGI